MKTRLLLSFFIAVLLVVSKASGQVIINSQVNLSPEMGELMVNHVEPKVSQLQGIAGTMKFYATIATKPGISSTLRNALNERYLLLKEQYTTIAVEANSIHPLMIEYGQVFGQIFTLINFTSWTIRVRDNLNEGKGELLTITLPNITPNNITVSETSLAESDLSSAEAAKVSGEILSEVRQRLNSVMSGMNSVREFGSTGLNIFASLDGNPHFSTIVMTAREACQIADQALLGSGIFPVFDSVLDRLRELALQSSTNVLSQTQRMALEMEFRALVRELHYISIDFYAFGQSPLQGELDESGIVRWSETNQRYEMIKVKVTNLDPLHLGGAALLGSSKIRGNSTQESIQFSQNAITAIDATRTLIEKTKSELLKLKEFSC